MLTHREGPMNPRYYHRHTPLLDPQRRRCPVCQHAVYSLAGIHPQCAERQADPPRPKGKAKTSLRRNEQATQDEADAIVEQPTAD
jgi:MoxR-like ATPase